MSTPVSQQKMLWHLTPLANMGNILKNGLLSRSRLASFSDIADPEIIAKRKVLGLDNYVPFHFFQGNPFDGKVLKDHLDTRFCYINVRRIRASELNWKILVRHPLSTQDSLEIFDYAQGMAAIDWKLVDSRNYHNDDCKQACMAECLAPDSVPPSEFFAIAVENKEDEDSLRRLPYFSNVKQSHIDIKPYCFYRGNI